MSKDAGSQTVTQTVDPSTQAYINEVRNRARQVAGQGYTANPNPTVAGIDPLSRQSTGYLTNAYNQLGYLGGASANQAEFLNQQGQSLNNLGAQFGRTGAGYSGGLANGFDQLAGNMRGVASGYGQTAQNMMGLGGNFDQQAGGMGQLAQGYDARMDAANQLGQRFNPYITAGQTGAAALGGNAQAAAGLMNPYQQQVLDAVGADYDKQRAQAHTDANQAATAAGAFGGSRHGVMEGARLGELDQGEMSTMAGLRAQGFNDAMSRAGEAANLGLGAGSQDLAGRQLGQGYGQMGMQARGLGQGYNSLGMQARGLGAQFGNLGLNAEQVGQGYNGMGMDARNLGLQYDNLGLGARNAATGAYQGALGAYGQAGQLAGAGANAAQGLFNMGDYYRAVNQQGLNDQDARFREQRDWDLRNLGVLQSGIGSQIGSTQSQQMKQDPWQQILGTGLTIGSFFL